MTEQEIRELIRGLGKLAGETDRLGLGVAEVFDIMGAIVAHVAHENIGDRAATVFREEDPFLQN